MSRYLFTKTHRTRSSKTKRWKWIVSSIAFSLFFLFLVFYTPVSKKIFLLLEPVYVYEMKGLGNISRGIRNFLRSQSLTKEDVLSVANVLDARERYISFLEKRIVLLERELSLSRGDFSFQNGKYEWVLHKSSDKSLLIQGGENKGYRRFDLAVSRAGDVVGYLDEVYPHSSRVRFLSSPGVKSEGILSPPHISVSLEGNGRNIIVFLPRDGEVSEGDSVFLQCFPEIPVGRVAHIQFDSRDPQKRIVVQNSLSFSQIHSLFVVKGSSVFCGEGIHREKTL